MILCPLILAMSISHATPPAMLPNRDAVATLANAALKAWNVPGVAVVVVRVGQEPLIAGFGQRSVITREPVTGQTLFPIASCTKAFTTTLMAMLATEGKFDLDAPVRRYLPEFHLADPHADQLVKVRDLLSHRTGVGGHDFLWYRAPWPTRESVRRINHLPLEGPFRASYFYSTLMYLAAGEALESATHEPWETLLREKLLTPLGMKQTLLSTNDPVYESREKATGYERGPDATPRPMPRYPIPTPNAAGSVHLSADDLAIWLELQLGRGVVRGQRIVPAAAFEQTFRPHTIIPMNRSLQALNPDTVQMHYALGWLSYDYRGHRVLAHGGMIDGFRVQFMVLPESNLAIGLLNNLHDTKMNQALGDSLVDLTLGLPSKDWDTILLAAVAADAKLYAEEVAVRKAARRADLPMALEFKNYAGDYENPAYGVGRIEATPRGLVWHWSSFALTLEHWEGEAFRSVGGLLDDQSVEFRTRDTTPDAVRFMGQVFKRK